MRCDRPEKAALGRSDRTLSDVRLVIFDFDGVIADSEVLSLSTLKQALARFGIDQTDADVRTNFLGKSLSTIAQYVASTRTDGTADGFADSWQNDLFDAFRTSLLPVPSIKPVLDHFKEANLPFCVASSSTFERLDVALEAIGLKHSIPDVFSAEQVARGKPAPDLFLLAARRMNVAPEACLVVEDSPYGVRAATRAGMRSVGFVGGQHLTAIAEDHGQLLQQEGALCVIDTHEALIEMGLAFPNHSA